MPAYLDSIVAQLRADTAQHDTAITRSSQLYDQLGGRSVRSTAMAEGGMRNLRHSVLSLALSSVELDHNVGRMISSLLLLGAGSTIVLGVAAGIAGIAAAYTAFTSAATEAAEAQKKLAEGLAGMGPHAQAVAARIKLGELETKEADIQAKIAQFTDNSTVSVQQRAILEPKLIAIQAELATQATIVARAQQDAAEATKTQYLNIVKINEALALEVRQMEAAVLQARIAAAGGGPLAALRSRGPTVPIGIRPARLDPRFMLPLPSEEEVNRISREIDRVLEETTREVSPFVEQLGRSLGHIFADALINGIHDFKDLFKSVLGAFLEAGINFGIKKIIPGLFGGSLAASTAVPGITAQVQGQGTMAAMVLPPVPAMIHPYDAARMAEWQAIFRETALVARGQGFRG